MDGVQTSGDVDPVRESVIRRRRKWSAQEKAQIVQEAQRPGAMLHQVAQRHGLHPTLLTRWRKQHQRVGKKASVQEARLLPVRFEPRTRASARVAQADCVSESTSRLGTIEVELSADRRLQDTVIDEVLPEIKRRRAE